MKRYTLKLIVAIAAIVGLSAMIAIFNVPAACAACIVGGLNVLSRHLDRCHFCGGWRVKVEENWYPNGKLPGWNEATEYRICKRCGIQEIDHYSLRDLTPFHL